MNALVKPIQDASCGFWTSIFNLGGTERREVGLDRAHVQADRARSAHRAADSWGQVARARTGRDPRAVQPPEQVDRQAEEGARPAHTCVGQPATRGPRQLGEARKSCSAWLAYTPSQPHDVPLRKNTGSAGMPQQAARPPAWQLHRVARPAPGSRAPADLCARCAALPGPRP